MLCEHHLFATKRLRVLMLSSFTLDSENSSGFSADARRPLALRGGVLITKG